MQVMLDNLKYNLKNYFMAVEFELVRAFNSCLPKAWEMGDDGSYL